MEYEALVAFSFYPKVFWFFHKLLAEIFLEKIVFIKISALSKVCVCIIYEEPQKSSILIRKFNIFQEYKCWDTLITKEDGKKLIGQIFNFWLFSQTVMVTNFFQNYEFPEYLEKIINILYYIELPFLAAEPLTSENSSSGK